MENKQLLGDYIAPQYTIKKYTDEIYKIIKYKVPHTENIYIDKIQHNTYDNKLEQSLSRARSSILQLALCNNWDYFCTFTLSPLNFDRFDLDTWYKKFSQWLRDYRKKGFDIAFVLVPERHSDGSWHCHGLLRLDSSQVISFSDLISQGANVPFKLSIGGYFDWPAYSSKFGFCSLSPIRDSVAVSFYLTKYITKDSSRLVSDVGKHLYYCSRGLNRAIKHIDVFHDSPDLDLFLTHDYEFVKTGFTHSADGLDWSFALEHLCYDSDYILPQFVRSLNSSSDEVQKIAEELNMYIQAVLEGFDINL